MSYLEDLIAEAENLAQLHNDHAEIYLAAEAQSSTLFQKDYNRELANREIHTRDFIQQVRGYLIHNLYNGQ